ncbi:MAG TPA: TRAP transporter small permease [Steroidobacteraceae bacterium]|nr:TRAP transporter small permease [Steroidobacteraceae bacterium]
MAVTEEGLNQGRGGWLGGALTVLARIATVIAGASLVGMAVVEGWQVFARYVLNDSPSWTEPVALLLMSTVMMVGAAVGTRNDAHFGFFIAVEHTPVRLRRVLLAIARLIAIAVGLMLSIWGGRLLVDGWGVPMAGAPLPQGIVFLPFCVGGALIVVFAIERLITSPTSRTGA